MPNRKKSKNFVTEGTLDMRINQHYLRKNMPSEEDSAQRWDLFTRLCTVLEADAGLIWQAWQAMGYDDRDLVNLKVYRRRSKLPKAKGLR